MPQAWPCGQITTIETVFHCDQFIGIFSDSETVRMHRMMCAPEVVSRLCPRCRAVMHALGELEPLQLTATDVARQAGLRHRTDLSRHLARHRLPKFTTLRDWRLTLFLAETWHRDRRSAMRNGWIHGLDPSTCYRAVHRATGMQWCRVRAYSVAHWVDTISRTIDESKMCHATKRNKKPEKTARARGAQVP